jgi:hypothetical protein
MQRQIAGKFGIVAIANESHQILVCQWFNPQRELKIKNTPKGVLYLK